MQFRTAKLFLLVKNHKRKRLFFVNEFKMMLSKQMHVQLELEIMALTLTFLLTLNLKTPAKLVLLSMFTIKNICNGYEVSLP